MVLALLLWGCQSPVTNPTSGGGPSGGDDPTPTPIATPIPQDPATQKAPVPDAGPDRIILVGQPATLNGAVTNDPGTDLTYLWTQSGGPAVSLSGADTAGVTFTPLTADTYTFTLTVSNAGGAGTDTVSVTAKTSDSPTPVANAGADRTAKSGSIVDLDGRGSYDPAGGTLTYRWRQLGGTVVSLQNTGSAVCSFTAPSITDATPLTFELCVQNAQKLDAVDTVAITVSSQGVNQYNLAVLSAGQGTVTPAGGAYDTGTTLSLTAAPADGWIFDHWAGDLTGSATPAPLTMDANKFVTAFFIEQGQVATPVFSVATNTHFSAALPVDITCTTPGAQIYYTYSLDDSVEPTPDTGTLYAGTLTLRKSGTLKARAYLPPHKPSLIATADYYAQLVPGL